MHIHLWENWGENKEFGFDLEVSVLKENQVIIVKYKITSVVDVMRIRKVVLTKLIKVIEATKVKNFEG